MEKNHKKNKTDFEVLLVPVLISYKRITILLTEADAPFSSPLEMTLQTGIKLF